MGEWPAARCRGGGQGGCGLGFGGCEMMELEEGGNFYFYITYLEKINDRLKNW